MGKSSRHAAPAEPAAAWKPPYAGFALSHHPPSGRLYKKIRGTRYYFGYASDWKAAIEKYERDREALYAGRKPRPKVDGLPMEDAVNWFLDAKDSAVKTGELTQRSWNDYKRTCASVLSCFGRSRIVEDLQPSDFAELKGAMAKGRNLNTLSNEIQRVRCVFKYLADADLIPRPVKFGPGFKRPDKKARRRLRNDRQTLAYTAAEIRQILKFATPNLKAMVLMAMNCGFGNNDLASLPVHKIDLDRGWHTFGRPKTGVERRAPLWPETIAALRDVLANRPAARDEADADLVFLTRHGRPYVRLQAKADAPDGDLTVWNDAISRATGKLLRTLGIHRNGLNFYSLRRTFRTIADEARDQPATVFLMGHSDSDSDMSATYRQYIEDERLQAVVDHVHAWLFAEQEIEAKELREPEAVPANSVCSD